MWTTIAVVGMQLYQGKLNYCTAATYPKGMLLKAFEPDKINHFGHSLENWPYKQFKYGDFDGPNNTCVTACRTTAGLRGERSGVQMPRILEDARSEYPIKHPQYNRLGEVVESVESFKIVVAFTTLIIFGRPLGARSPCSRSTTGINSHYNV